jgi:hypothetical protein
METIQKQMKANQEKMEDLQEEMKSQIGLLISRLDTNEAKTEANQEWMIVEMKAHQVRMVVRLESKMYSWLEKMETHQGKMEAMIRTGEKQM